MVMLNLKTTHCLATFDEINKMRLNSQMTDFTLKAGGVAIHAHRLVLASTSSFFSAMFNGDMVENRSKEVELDQFDVEVLQLLIDYAYTGEIEITEANAEALLTASSFFQMHTIREACCDFLVKQLSPSNCLGIKQLADLHSCTELLSQSSKFVLQNFKHVLSSEEFLLLSFREVEELISDNRLDVTSEEKVFKAVVDWVKKDSQEREKFFPKLFSHVRLPFVSKKYLAQTVNTEMMVRKNKESINQLLEAMSLHLLPAEERVLIKGERTDPRRPEGPRTYVFAIGGFFPGEIAKNSCEAYNTQTEKWFSIASMNFKRLNCGVIGLENLLYVVGGYDIRTLSSVERYDPQTNQWTVITSMGTNRYDFGICSCNGFVVCGGSNGSSILSSVERYDPLTAQWSSYSSMLLERFGCRSAALGSCMYVVGGFNGSSHLSSVEKLDPREGRWTQVPSMSSGRSSPGVAATERFLYCTGGFNNDGFNTAERFDVRRNAWEPIAPMRTRRQNHGFVTCEGSLIALGGPGSSVERYDVYEDRWHLMTEMIEPRLNLGASVLECNNLELVIGSSSP